jgi:hypothetical protein
MHAANRIRRPASVLRSLLTCETGGGLVLMANAALTRVVANAPLAETNLAALKSHLGPLCVLHRINDALMAVVFLPVGLEIEREMLVAGIRRLESVGEVCSGRAFCQSAFKRQIENPDVGCSAGSSRKPLIHLEFFCR